MGPTGSLLTEWSTLVLATNTQHSHAHLTGTPQVPPNTSIDALLPDTPAWTQGPLLTGDSILNFATKYTHKHHAYWD